MAIAAIAEDLTKPAKLEILMNLDMGVDTECHGFGLNKKYEDEKIENNDLVGFLNDEKPGNPLL